MADSLLVEIWADTSRCHLMGSTAVLRANPEGHLAKRKITVGLADSILSLPVRPTHSSAYPVSIGDYFKVYITARKIGCDLSHRPFAGRNHEISISPA